VARDSPSHAAVRQDSIGPHQQSVVLAQFEREGRVGSHRHVGVVVFDGEWVARPDERHRVVQPALLGDIGPRGRLWVTLVPVVGGHVTRNTTPPTRIAPDGVAAPEEESLAVVAQDAGDDRPFVHSDGMRWRQIKLRADESAPVGSTTAERRPAHGSIRQCIQYIRYSRSGVPISSDRFEALGDDTDGPTPGTNAAKLLAFLRSNPDKAFTQSELAAETDVTAGSVGPTLVRLRERGRVDHRGNYWRVSDHDSGVDDAAGHAAGALFDRESEGETPEMAEWEGHAVDPSEHGDE
jgi:hypothetical protein